MASIGADPEGFSRVGDIGLGGFSLKTPLSFEVGQQVPVRLQFPDLWEEVDVSARVAWRRTSGEVGFEVPELDPDDAGLLAVMIAHQEVLGRMALLC